MINILYFPTQKVLSANIKHCVLVVCNILAKCKNTGDRIGTKKTLTSANEGFCQNKHLQRKESFLFIFTFVNTDICTLYQSLSGWSRFSQHGSRATSQSLLLLDFSLYFFSFVCKDTFFPSKRIEWRRFINDNQLYTNSFTIWSEPRKLDTTYRVTMKQKHSLEEIQEAISLVLQGEMACSVSDRLHFMAFFSPSTVPSNVVFYPFDAIHIISSEDIRFSLGYRYLIWD